MAEERNIGRELMLQTLNALALSEALTVTTAALNQAHLFIDIVTAEDSASVLSDEDVALSEAVHEIVVGVSDAMDSMNTQLVEAAEKIISLTSEQITEIIFADGPVSELVQELPATSDDDLPGQYL